MRLLLATIILTFLAHPVSAKTVYYYATDEVALMDTSGVKKGASERFKMAFDDVQVEINGDGEIFRGGISLDVDIFLGWRFYAKDNTILKSGHRLTTTLAHFDGKILTYTQIGVNSTISINATCDKF